MTPDAGDRPPLSQMAGDRILLRGRDLADELVGRVTFTEVLLGQLRGCAPAPNEVRVMDAVLVAVMEHGLTPSALATRLVLDAAPEALQGAVAAGLLATGSRFLGAMRESALLLADVAAGGDDIDTSAERHVRAALERGERLPGFGHNLHQAADPRVPALLRVARREGTFGAHCAALEAVTRVVSTVRPELIANAAGAIAALVVDLGFTADQARGFALIARCAGLVAHASEEVGDHRARHVWEGLH